LIASLPVAALCHAARRTWRCPGCGQFPGSSFAHHCRACQRALPGAILRVPLPGDPARAARLARDRRVLSRRASQGWIAIAAVIVGVTVWLVTANPLFGLVGAVAGAAIRLVVDTQRLAIIARARCPCCAERVSLASPGCTSCGASLGHDSSAS
jgi:hypothetical protein